MRFSSQGLKSIIILTALVKVSNDLMASERFISVVSDTVLRSIDHHVVTMIRIRFKLASKELH